MAAAAAGDRKLTGTVTWEVLAWIVGIISVAGIAVAGFLFWVWRLVDGIQKSIDDELAKRDLKTEGALGRAMQVEAELNEYKVHAAEKFATKDGVTQAIDRMEAAVEKLTTQVHDAVERLTNRLDRILESREPGRRQ